MEFLWLSLILILSAVLNFWNLTLEGYGNTYYAAGVKSMLMSFKNFFFVASDPSGFVSIDKPPVGFWLQAVSAKLFGFSGFSIILPQALAGVLSVTLLYFLVKKYFGSFAGLIAALCLTVTPIFVAASRNNTIDNQLVLCLLIACYFLLTAMQNKKAGYLILSLAIVGIGFNIKMAEAYLILPAIYITYFLSSSASFKKKAMHLIAGSVVLIIISLSWAFIVDLVPASDRPFVGSSTNNSVLQLIIGHNGFERIGLNSRKLSFGFNNKEDKKRTSKVFTSNTANQKYDNKPAANNSSFYDRNSTGMGNGSRPSILRLFSNNNISDQISWLLPFALLGFIASAIKEKLKYPFDNNKKLSLLLWILWLITEAAYFSFTSGGFHTYYLTTMAPSIAALAGIGFTSMSEQYNKNGPAALFLPSVFLLNGLAEVLILSYGFNKSDGYKTLFILTSFLCFSASIILYLMIAYKKFLLPQNAMASIKLAASPILRNLVIIIAFIGIISAPTVWSFTPLIYRMNSSSPFAGFELSANGKKAATLSNYSKLIAFLNSNRTTEKYLVAVPSASYASDIILESGEPVMTVGGFSGSDKIITLDQFKQLVSTGKLRYALINSDTSRKTDTKAVLLNRKSDNDVVSWIKANGKLVSSNKWQTSKSSHNMKSKGNNTSMPAKLYDLNSAVN